MKLELKTPKDVMIAFLNGHKLVNSKYNPDCSQDHFLYLDENGWIAEEDGATAKTDRVPMAMRMDEQWWIYKEGDEK